MFQYLILYFHILLIIVVSLDYSLIILDFTFISEHLILHTSSSIKKVLIHSGFKNIKIKYFQRHNLDNFLYWIMTGRPGGHNKFQISSKKSKINFEKYLIKNNITDTLIVTAEK